MSNNEFESIEGVDNSQDVSSNQSKPAIHEIRDFFKDIIIILILVVIIKSFLVSPFKISGSSMEASYHDKEFIIVNKFTYANFGLFTVGNPVRGDVVVFEPHVGNGKEYYIKRVIGLPGDTVKIDNGEVSIKLAGKKEFIKLNEDYLSPVNKGKTFTDSSVKENEFLVPDGEYFLMGDNRNNSSDSRSCFYSCSTPGATHFIRRANITGKVLLDLGYYNIFQDGSLKLGDLKWVHPPRWLSSPKDWIYGELNK